MVGSCLATLGDLSHFTEEFIGIEADYFRKLQELDDIDASSAGFDRGDHRLVSAERFREVGLAHAGFPAFVDYELNEAHMPWRTKGFLHMRCRPLTKPADQLNRNTGNQKIWLLLGR